MRQVELEENPKQDDPIGKTDYHFFTKEVADRYRANDLAVMESQKESMVEEPVTLPNGKTITQLSTKRPFYDKDGQVAGVVGNTVDITHVKEIEAELRTAKEKVAEAKAKQALFDCVAQVSHDIRSPLAALNTALKNLSHLPEDQRILIRNAVRRINDIANNLLVEYRNDNQNDSNKQRVDSQQHSMKPELLASLLDTLVSEKIAQINNPSIELDLDIHEEAFGTFVSLDAIQFKRVISNLLNNAVEAIEGAGKIILRVIRQLDRVILEVHDNGKGIPADKLDKIKQGGTSYGKKAGSGIGLATAIEFFKQIKGDFDLTSELGKGTTLTIDLPTAIAPDWFKESLTIQPNFTLVVLDDDKSIHSIWTSRCQPLINQITVKHTYSSTEFRECCESADFSSTLFLMDYELLNSEESGLDLIERLDLGDLAVLVTSRYEEQSVKERAQRLNVKIIPKNFSPYIPIKLLNKSESALVFLDDDRALTTVWEREADYKGISILTFNRVADLEEALPTIDKNTPIYIDSNLGGEVNGEEFAKELYGKGFQQLYLASGHPESHFGKLPWIKGFTGKEPPF